MALTSADVVTQWHFNSVTPDANTATGDTNPSIGSGVASLFGGVTATFASCDASGGSSDPAVGDNTAWNLRDARNPTGLNLSQGAIFSASTVGFDNVTVNWDQRQSNSSGRFSAFEYSLDGINFTTLTNPAFDPPGPSFVRTDTGVGPIAATGTWRLDMVTVNGTVAIPEPSTLALLGLAGVV